MFFKLDADGATLHNPRSHEFPLLLPLADTGFCRLNPATGQAESV